MVIVVIIWFLSSLNLGLVLYWKQSQENHVFKLWTLMIQSTTWCGNRTHLGIKINWKGKNGKNRIIIIGILNRRKKKMKRNLIKESVMFITGRRKNINVNGPESKTKAYVNVLVASKDLYEALNDKKPNLSEIKRIMKAKDKLAKIYQKATGTVWPL